jgi:hypothetical protein
MSDNSQISFDLDTSSATNGIGIDVWLNNQNVFSTRYLETRQHVTFDVADQDGDHELRIVILGKTAEHTEVDDHGYITKDVVIHIENFVIDGLEVNQLFQEKAKYIHNFNGTGNEIQDKFYGSAGCNGTISFEFTTPIYLWLLENM